MATTAIFPLEMGSEAWNSGITQEWDVAEAKAASGRRRTLVTQTLPGLAFDVKYNALTKAQRDSLVGFYAQMKGGFNSFWWMDYSHHHADRQTLTAGTDSKYQCLIVDGNFAENAEKVANLNVFINGTETTNFTESGGKITIAAVVPSGAVVTATYDYYYKVAFADKLTIKEKFIGIYEVSVKLKVVRE